MAKIEIKDTEKEGFFANRSPRSLLGIFVSISFCLTVAAGVGVITYTSEGTLERLKYDNTRIEVENAANLFVEQLKHIELDVIRTAEHPDIINYTIGLEVSEENVTDRLTDLLGGKSHTAHQQDQHLAHSQLDSHDIGMNESEGHSAHHPSEADDGTHELMATSRTSNDLIDSLQLKIFDAASEVVYGHPSEDTAIQASADELMNTSGQHIQYLYTPATSEMHAHLTVMAPIQYRDLTEGVISITIPFDIEQVFKGVLSDGNRWIALSSMGTGVRPMPRFPDHWQMINYPLDELGFVLHYGINKAQIIQQRNTLISEITLVLMGGMALIFVLVYFLGEGIVLAPYRALMKTRQTIDDQNAKIVESEARNKVLAQVAEHAHDSIIICDAEGKIEWINPAFERQTGYTQEEAIGQIPGHLLQGDETDPYAVQELRDAVNNERSVRIKILNYTKEKEPYWVDIDLSSIKDDAGNLERFIAVERDVTHLEHLLEENRQAIEKAEMANKAKSQFLANMSHEIRTPMNGVLGLAQILMRSDVDEDQLKHLHNLYSSGQHMMSILNDILDLSKVEAGKLSLDPTVFRFGDLQENLLSIYTSMATEKGLELKIDNHIDENQAFFADQARIRQVLFNLIGNAIKFTDSGSVTVFFDMIGTGIETRKLTMKVIDTGVGIPPERLKSIFTPFEQAELSTTRRFGGTGLGLSIIKHLAELMNGDVSAESIVNRGSVFTVDVEVELADLADVEDTSKPAEEVAFTMASFGECKALVVDDIPLNTMIVSNFLKARGFSVETAENGQIALDKVRDNDYQIVIMDNHMPVMDGVEATSHIRNLPEPRGNTLVVACTADAFKETRTVMMEAGCNEVMVKPIDEKKFDQCLAKFEKRILSSLVDDHSVKSQSLASKKKEEVPESTAPADNSVEESPKQAEAKPTKARAKARPQAAAGSDDQAKPQAKATAKPRAAAQAKASARPASAPTEDAEAPAKSKAKARPQARAAAKAQPDATDKPKATARPAAKARPKAKAAAKPAAKPTAQAKPKAEAKAAAPAAPKIDKVIDENGLNEALGGDQDMIKQVLQMFVDTNDGDVNKLRNFVNEGDLSEAHRYAHSTKGTSAYLSANDFHAQALKVEQTAKEGNAPSEEDLVLFEAMLSKALEEAKALIQKYS